ncbi:MAG: hypothetical protein LIP08_16080 [Bacteroides sp.]|nr:hypothetical protein [Bacteroides sp.]
MKIHASIAHVVYTYLHRLSVKVSLSQVENMLDTPVGNSIRGVSDVLDQLSVSNEVYQLPTEYLDRLEAPFLTVMHIQEESFCLVEALDTEYVTLTTHKRKQVRLRRDNFLQFWTGTVLLAKKSQNIPEDRWHVWKDRWYLLTSFLPVIIGVLLFVLIAGCAPFYPFSIQGIGLLTALFLGISASVAILYKEYVDKDFMQRFCKVGEQVDCNLVIHSKGARLPGGMTLGEAGLIFFLSCLSFIVYMPEKYVFPIQCVLSIAFLMTLYSVYYQFGILHKICNLCMVINVAVWGMMATVWKSISYTFSIHTGLSFLVFAGVGLLITYGWLVLKRLLLLRGEGLKYKVFRSVLVRDTELFQLLLEKQPTVPSEYTEWSLTNGNSASETTVLLITHPNCEHCMRLHKIIQKMESRLNVQLIFQVNPSDQKVFSVMQQITECYLSEGRMQSMRLLEKWYQSGELPPHLTPSSRTLDMLRKQDEFCRSLKISGTPVVFIHGKRYPDMYQFEDLEYIL